MGVHGRICGDDDATEKGPLLGGRQARESWSVGDEGMGGRGPMGSVQGWQGGKELGEGAAFAAEFANGMSGWRVEGGGNKRIDIGVIR